MRTIQQQLQDIADWIDGKQPKKGLKSADFTEGPLREAWRAVASFDFDADPGSRRQQCYDALRGALVSQPHGPRLYDRLRRVIPSSNKHPFSSLAQISDQLQPIEWLWPGWLPRSMITMLAARPGVGKSMLALDLARRLMIGETWPDGTPAPSAADLSQGETPRGRQEPRPKVIYVDGEGIPQVHNARAAAWNLPRDQLYMLLADEQDVLVDLGRDKYQDLLTQMVFRLKPALVIVDSLGAVLGKGENSVEDVRGAMGFLAGLSSHYEVAVLLIHHMRKSLGGMTPYAETIDADQIRGSSHITAMSRMVWGLTAVHPRGRADPNGPRRLQVIKSNLARHPEPLGLLLEPMDEDAGLCGPVKVTYQETPAAYRGPTSSEAAGQWLLEYLDAAGAPLPPKLLIAAAQDMGFSRAALYRAREALAGKIVDTAPFRAPDNCWRLVSEAAEAPRAGV